MQTIRLYFGDSRTNILLLCSALLILISCSKNSLGIDIQENIKSTENVIKYGLYINPTNGGTIIISSQQGIINETDLEQVPYTTYINSFGVARLEGKLVDEFDRDTRLNISVITDEGFEFTGWTIHICHKCYWGSRSYYINNPLFTLNINSHLFLTANFEKIL